MHLWEADHAYYCAEGNYFAKSGEQPTQHYKSWAEFIAEHGDAEFDYNLVFRWDWREGADYDLPEFNGDVNYRNGQVMVCWMGQCKGLYRWTTVEVCRADEPAVIAFLQPRLDYLAALWAPLKVSDDIKP